MIDSKEQDVYQAVLRSGPQAPREPTHHTHTYRVRHAPRIALVALVLAGLLAPVRDIAGQGSMSAPETEEEIAHPFLTHMGIPEGVGVFSLRASGLVTRAEGKSEGDFGFHFETGLTKTIGLHIRNDAFRTNAHTEVMFQFAAIMSKDGMSGFAPIIEFEFPTRSGVGARTESLIGFTTALTKSPLAFNQVIHYNPREEGGDASVALVARVAERFFPVLEVLGEAGKGSRPVVALLAGLKMSVREGINLGFAYQFPVTNNRDFSSRLILQPEYEWTTRR